jgi:putative flavoprotein involved in K+ transport
MKTIHTLVIGGGQAGLATSYHLTNHKIEHLVLEKAAQAGRAWRGLWDSFSLLTPNWSFQLPGAEYKGNNPDGFLTREEVVSYFEQYVDDMDIPVKYKTQVDAVENLGEDEGYLVRTSGGDFEAENVVVATGMFQDPKFPPFASAISSRITQLHSSQYRNPRMLPLGAVLVVGSAQSGCQIAEELYQSGRKVYLCVGSAGRAPRQYRGRDIFSWLLQLGFFDRTVDKLPSPRAKFAGNPHLSGRDGGHTINLHQFARDGVQLLGRITGAQKNTIYLANDLKDSLAKADKFETDLVKMIDEFIAKNGIDAQRETLPNLKDGYAAGEVLELNLAAQGINTIIWAQGFGFDFSMVKLPVTDADGYPIQRRGVTKYPGLYFAGLPWLSKYKSGLIVGVGEDAEYIASHIASGYL